MERPAKIAMMAMTTSSSMSVNAVRRGEGILVELGVLRMECQRDEGLEAVRFVLQFAQLAEVVDTVLGLFDMAVEHRRVGEIGRAHV